MTELARILEVLEDVPATAREVSDETGIPVRRVSIYLSTLKASGVLLHCEVVPPETIVIRKYQVYGIAQEPTP